MFADIQLLLSPGQSLTRALLDLRPALDLSCTVEESEAIDF